MPTSNPQNVSRILETVLAFRPRSVLDIGVGMGKMGFLLREYLDLLAWGDGETWPPPRVARIDGIEGHADYIGDIQRNVYDELMIGDALSLLPRIAPGTYDIVLMIDVLEHLTEVDALRLVREASRVGARILAVVPAGARAQGSSYGNEYERHRMRPRRRTLKQMGFSSVYRYRGSYFAHRPHSRAAARRWRAEYRARNVLRRLPAPAEHAAVAIGKRLLRY